MSAKQTAQMLTWTQMGNRTQTKTMRMRNKNWCKFMFMTAVISWILNNFYSGVYVLDSLRSGHPEDMTNGVIDFLKNKAESQTDYAFQKDNFRIFNVMVIFFLYSYA